MTANITPNIVVSMPSQLFTMPTKFASVFNGKIYLGEIDKDPTIQSNQIPVYVENEDGTYTQVSQPIRTSAAGYPVYNGLPAKFVTEKGYSMKVTDSLGAQLWYFPNILKYDPDQFEKRIREELKSEKGSEIIGYNLGQPSSQLTTVARSLRNSIDLASDFVPGGVISGKPDLTAHLQAAIVAAFNLGISEVSAVGDFFISATVFIYPGVTIVGGGYDKTLIRCSDSMPAGTTMFRTYRPSGWAPGCNNVGARDVYLVGRPAKDTIAVDVCDSYYYKFSRVRTDLFAVAWDFNKWIDDGRVSDSSGFTYPRAKDPHIGGQCYFGTFEQCSAINCTRAVRTACVVNRQTEISCTWASCALAYDFSNPRGVYETNTYISTNIEGCEEVWAWFYNINSPYTNTWITTSIDNGNDFTCNARDGGRQVFINLSLFPYNDPKKVNWFLDNPNGHRSTVMGTDIGENLGDLQLKTQFRETVHFLSGVCNKLFGVKQISASIQPAGGTYRTTVDIPGLPSGSAVSWSLGRLYPGTVVQVASITADSVNVEIYNSSNVVVNIDTTISVTGISKSFL